MRDRAGTERQLGLTKRMLESLRQHELDRIIDAREQKVLRLRMGLEDGRRYKLREIGMELGIRKERVRQIQMKALGKLARREGRG